VRNGHPEVAQTATSVAERVASCDDPSDALVAWESPTRKIVPFGWLTFQVQREAGKVGWGKSVHGRASRRSARRLPIRSPNQVDVPRCTTVLRLVGTTRATANTPTTRRQLQAGPLRNGCSTSEYDAQAG